MIPRGGSAKPAASRLRAFAAVAAMLSLAGCSRPQSPPTEFPGGIAVPPEATDLHDRLDDQFRTMSAYYRFELPSRRLPALTVALRCNLGEIETAPRAAETGDPAWFAPVPNRPHRRCESQLAGWFYQLDVDVSRPDRYTVYLLAFN
ncbi:hypothetical protein J5226_12140 [Lysobacter sp. K5869]|uniref:hypothetical protein n=1 Tax=Lysobacter sp. K5869 TaxID=2820808 RepID=UPI001C061908|nr:hypothetical protein [Lysobacter sp. K5869]QWP79083.1 hypothetical protein J5226_12140 [Lysobacter sp. K5869]